MVSNLPQGKFVNLYSLIPKLLKAFFACFSLASTSFCICFLLNLNSAIFLANEIGINKNQIFEDYKEDSFHDLTLILGQNFSKLKSYKTAQTFNPFNND